MLKKIEEVRRQMLARHPQLSGLIDQPDLAWICVRVNAFQLLDAPSTDPTMFG